MIYSKIIQVADIIIRIESSLDFVLSYKYKPFILKDSNRYDILLKINEKDEIDFNINDYNEIYQNERYSVISDYREDIRIKKKKNSEDIECYTKKINDNVYEVSFIKNKKNHSVLSLKPLELMNLEEVLLAHNCNILHSSIISYKNQGVVFTAPSGTGKTTQANLWNDFYGADIINGDRTIIRKTEESLYRGYGSPYAGSSGIYKNEKVDLSMIIILKQAKENRLKEASLKEAYLYLLSQSSISGYDKKLIEKQVMWIEEMIHNIPIYVLECRPDKKAVDLVYKKLGELKNGTK